MVGESHLAPISHVLEQECDDLIGSWNRGGITSLNAYHIIEKKRWVVCAGSVSNV